jgi:hypothetical protein
MLPSSGLAVLVEVDEPCAASNAAWLSSRRTAPRLPLLLTFAGLRRRLNVFASRVTARRD